MEQLEVKISKYSGYCFGVKRALDLAMQALDKEKTERGKVYTIGSIIHNPGVVSDLSERGLISVDSVDCVEDGSTFIIRSHGISPDIIKALEEKCVDIVDATCPFVKRAQSKASGLSSEGYHVVVIGSKDHPEVRGIKGQVKEGCIDVITSQEDLESFDSKKKIGVVVQTTQTMEKLKEIMIKLLDKTRELKIINTICDTTRKRHESVRELSAEADVMLVVGGKNSANTTHLAHISKENNPSTYHIEDKNGLKKEWLKDAVKVGICGGASTPEEDILKIKKIIEDM